MTTTTHPLPSQPALALARRAWAFNPLLTTAVFIHMALIPLLLVAAVLDPRLIMGAPAWVKPLKFALSIPIFMATFMWLLTFVEGRPRAVKFVANLTAIGLLVEMALIALQVVRGTTSHFNLSTPFDGAVFSLMGSFITAVSVCTLLLAIWLIRQRLPNPVLAWGLRWGVLVSFVGMMVAFLMTSYPTPSQLEAAEATGQMSFIGAHSVGGEDGGVGLPLLGWSTTHGDLRVAHFFGLHAMQLLPLLGGLLSLDGFRRRWSEKGRTALVWVGSLGYLGLVLLLTGQALRGQSIIAPDGLTVGVGVLLGAAVAVAAAIIVRREK
ncbi:MAG: hypothetical protein OT477_22860 [Chloroflexi bacterium]|nr:hypothetical protein [Chloroflexota bacterium]